jgi:hypothetical protein
MMRAQFPIELEEKWLPHPVHRPELLKFFDRPGLDRLRELVEE